MDTIDETTNDEKTNDENSVIEEKEFDQELSGKSVIKKKLLSNSNFSPVVLKGLIDKNILEIPAFLRRQAN